jgi:hypothetical protein
MKEILRTNRARWLPLAPAMRHVGSHGDRGPRAIERSARTPKAIGDLIGTAANFDQGA